MDEGGGGEGRGKTAVNGARGGVKTGGKVWGKREMCRKSGEEGKYVNIEKMSKCLTVVIVREG